MASVTPAATQEARLSTLLAAAPSAPPVIRTGRSAMSFPSRSFPSAGPERRRRRGSAAAPASLFRRRERRRRGAQLLHRFPVGVAGEAVLVEEQHGALTEEQVCRVLEGG